MALAGALGPVLVADDAAALCVAGDAHPVSCLDGGQARVARPDNESMSLYVLGSKSFDPMWEEALTHCGLFVRQNRFIVSLSVVLTTSSIYVLYLFAARYFSALASTSGL